MKEDREIEREREPKMEWNSVKEVCKKEFSFVFKFDFMLFYLFIDSRKCLMNYYVKYF